MPQLAGDWQAAPPEYWASGVRNASSPIELLLTPNGRVKGWFAEEFQAEKISIIPLAYEVPGLGP